MPWSGTGFLCGETEIVPDQVHQVGGILAVMDGEGRLEADLAGVFPQQPRADGVEGAGPGQRSRQRSAVLPLDRRFAPKASLAMRWTRRVISTAARRENVMSRIRRGSVPLAARCTTRWASVLVLPDPAPAITRSAASSRDRGHRARNAVLDSAALVGIELVEIGRGHRRIALLEAKQDEPCPMFVRNCAAVSAGFRRMGGAKRYPSWAVRCGGALDGFRKRSTHPTSTVPCLPGIKTRRRAPPPRRARSAPRRPIRACRASP